MPEKIMLADPGNRIVSFFRGIFLSENTTFLRRKILRLYLGIFTIMVMDIIAGFPGIADSRLTVRLWRIHHWLR